jgi:hypothetical protein
MRLSGLLGVTAAAAIVVAACSGGDDDDGTSTTQGTGAGTTSGTGGATTTTGPGGGGMTMIPCNTPTASVTGPCDPLQQDCPPGQMCDVVGTATACVPASMGLIGKGGDCSGDQECSAGLRCVDCKCSPFCCLDNDLPCDGGVCDIQLQYPGGATAYMCSYKQSCTLFENTCVPTPCGNTACHPVDFMSGLAVCDLPSPDFPVAEGAECMFRNDCEESAHCNTGETPAVCRDLCDLANWMNLTPSQGGCEAMRTCTMIGGAAGFPGVGICMPM